MGFIGKLIGGIFAFLSKLLGIGKSDYYMEAEPLPAGAPASDKPAAEVKKVEPAKAAAATSAVKTSAEAATAKAELAPAPLETVKAAIAEAPAKAPANGSTNGSTDGKKARKAKAEAEKPAAPVKAAAPAKTDQTFAPNYLIQTSGSRRRPGPSMDYFRNIAKQVKS